MHTLKLRFLRDSSRFPLTRLASFLAEQRTNVYCSRLGYMHLAPDAITPSTQRSRADSHKVVVLVEASHPLVQPQPAPVAWDCMGSTLLTRSQCAHPPGSHTPTQSGCRPCNVLLLGPGNVLDFGFFSVCASFAALRRRPCGPPGPCFPTF